MSALNNSVKNIPNSETLYNYNSDNESVNFNDVETTQDPSGTYAYINSTDRFNFKFDIAKDISSGNYEIDLSGSIIEDNIGKGLLGATNEKLGVLYGGSENAPLHTIRQFDEVYTFNTNRDSRDIDWINKPIFSVRTRTDAFQIKTTSDLSDNFDVSYTVNGGTPIIETVSNVINPGDTITYVFNTGLDMSTDGIYNIDYECLLSNDQNPSNNLYTGNNENFLSPTPPVTVDDTICLGDTSFLEAISNQGLINWYSDPNGTSILTNNAVTPNITTTYYAEVQASNFYIDDFESYPTGSLIAQSSAYWTTLSGAGGGPFDAFISGAQMSSGNNSIYVNQLNDDDLYLLLNPTAIDGIVEISMDLRIETSAHINFQDESLPASNEIFEIILNSGILEFDIGPTVLTASYPGNNTWFNLKLEGNLASSTWNLYIDGVFVFGSYIAGADQIGSVNFRPEVGDEYYIDDVEWYIIADDDCISGLSPLTVNVEDCSSIGENIKYDLDLYPNPVNGILNFNGTNLIELIQVIDNHGKIVSEYNINSFKGSLDLSHLSRGIYFIKGLTNSGLIHKKIILN